jgi:DNA-binding HxlR family transcriptional regulator
VPPKVEYFLNDFGKSLTPMLDEIALWGRNLAQSKAKMVDAKKKSVTKKTKR